MSIEYSIIILVFDKEYEINLVLKALALQDYDKNKFEVIIIDDGSQKSIDYIIDRYKNEININYIRIEHTGIRAVNRNMGVEKSRGDKIIFLDGDMVPQSDMLSEFNKDIKDNPKNISLGVRTELFEFDRNFIDEIVIEKYFEMFKNLPGLDDERLCTVDYLKNPKTKIEWGWNLFYSHSICMWKKEFLEIGGFDSVFSEHWGAEDIELGYRLAKNGCNIKLNEKARLYHLYHASDILDKESELKINYRLFLKKHPSWDVEIFTKEIEVDPKYKIEIYSKIKNREYIITDIPDADELINSLPGKMVLYGIENSKLLDSVKTEKAFLPLSLIRSDKVENILGIDTTYENNYFNCAVISAKYLKANHGLYTYILNEASRIAKKVVIIDSENKALDNDIAYIKSIIKPSNYILFEFSGNTNNPSNYYFYNLAIAAHNVGIKTAVHFPMYADKKDKECFFKIVSPEKKALIGQLQDHKLDMILDKIPNILDPYFSEFNKFPLDFRILWQNFSYINEDKLVKNKLIGPYKYFFSMKNLNQETFDNSRISADILKLGIDKNKIESIKSVKKKSGGKFIFLWADFFTCSNSNLDILIDSFIELFENNPEVILKILCNNNLYNNFETPFFTGSKQSQLNINSGIESAGYNNYLCDLIKKHSLHKNIIFDSGIYDEEQLSEELYNCGCFINLSSSLDISMLVLESIAFGKKPLTPYSQRYENYFPVTLCHDIKTELKPLLYNNINYQENSNNDFGKYLLKETPLKESIKIALQNAYVENKSSVIDGNLSKNFIEENNWMQRGEELKALLKKYF